MTMVSTDRTARRLQAGALASGRRGHPSRGRARRGCALLAAAGRRRRARSTSAARREQIARVAARDARRVRVDAAARRGALWAGSRRGGAARERGSRGRCSSAAATMAVGAQLYFFGRYHAYMNPRAVLVGTSMMPSVGQQLWIDRASFLRAILPPVAARRAAAARAGGASRPSRPRAAADGARPGASARCSSRRSSSTCPAEASRRRRRTSSTSPRSAGSPPRAGSHDDARRARAPRAHARPRPVAAHRAAAGPRRACCFVVTESVRGADTCSAPAADCATTPYTNALLPDRLRLLADARARLDDRGLARRPLERPAADGVARGAAHGAAPLGVRARRRVRHGVLDLAEPVLRELGHVARGRAALALGERDRPRPRRDLRGGRRRRRSSSTSVLRDLPAMQAALRGGRAPVEHALPVRHRRGGRAVPAAVAAPSAPATRAKVRNRYLDAIRRQDAHRRAPGARRLRATPGGDARGRRVRERPRRADPRARRHRAHLGRLRRGGARARSGSTRPRASLAGTPRRQPARRCATRRSRSSTCCRRCSTSWASGTRPRSPRLRARDAGREPAARRHARHARSCSRTAAASSHARSRTGARCGHAQARRDAERHSRGSCFDVASRSRRGRTSAPTRARPAGARGGRRPRNAVLTSAAPARSRFSSTASTPALRSCCVRTCSTTSSRSARAARRRRASWRGRAGARCADVERGARAAARSPVAASASACARRMRCLADRRLAGGLERRHRAPRRLERLGRSPARVAAPRDSIASASPSIAFTPAERLDGSVRLALGGLEIALLARARRRR